MELKQALNAPEPTFDLQTEIDAVYSHETPQIPKKTQNDETRSEKRFVDVIQSSLRQAFDEDESLVIMGQDIAGYGGVFKITEGFMDRFGADRIRNTPIIESGVLGAAIGLALEGFKPVVEMQFSDFVSCGMNQIIQNIAKSKYRWSPGLNITIRSLMELELALALFILNLLRDGLCLCWTQNCGSWHRGRPQNLMYSSLFDPNLSYSSSTKTLPKFTSYYF